MQLNNVKYWRVIKSTYVIYIKIVSKIIIRIQVNTEAKEMHDMREMVVKKNIRSNGGD